MLRYRRIHRHHGILHTSHALRAVFSRDGYKCVFCGRGIKDKAVLHVHHIGFWKGDRTDRMANLATACEKCHTPKNHKPKGKLYGVAPELPAFKGATFMTGVRWEMLSLVKAIRRDVKISITYGAATKETRRSLKLKKTHSNDAYSMGRFHPKHRTDCMHYKKRRRNNRVLEKFYDAVYIDIRDGSKKKGSQIGCNRTNRREPRMSDKNERIFHGKKTKPGRRSVRTKRYAIQPGALLRAGTGTHKAKGIHCNGCRVMLDNGKSVSVKKVVVIRFPGAWELIS